MERAEWEKDREEERTQQEDVAISLSPLSFKAWGAGSSESV